MALNETLTASESKSARSSRHLKGRLALLACVAFWIVTVGGIILMLNMRS
jgi:hypothetical protein